MGIVHYGKSSKGVGYILARLRSATATLLFSDALVTRLSSFNYQVARIYQKLSEWRKGLFIAIPSRMLRVRQARWLLKLLVAYPVRKLWRSRRKSPSKPSRSLSCTAGPRSARGVRSAVPKSKWSLWKARQSFRTWRQQQSRSGLLPKSCTTLKRPMARPSFALTHCSNVCQTKSISATVNVAKRRHHALHRFRWKHEKDSTFPAEDTHSVYAVRLARIGSAYGLCQRGPNCLCRHGQPAIWHRRSCERIVSCNRRPRPRTDVQLSLGSGRVSLHTFYPVWQPGEDQSRNRQNDGYRPDRVGFQRLHTCRSWPKAISYRLQQQHLLCQSAHWNRHLHARYRDAAGSNHPFYF